MSYVKIIHFDKTKMEQSAGDGTDLESLPPMIIKITLRQLIP